MLSREAQLDRLLSRLNEQLGVNLAALGREPSTNMDAETQENKNSEYVRKDT